MQYLLGTPGIPLIFAIDKKHSLPDTCPSVARTMGIQIGDRSKFDLKNDVYRRGNGSGFHDDNNIKGF